MYRINAAQTLVAIRQISSGFPMIIYFVTHVA
jgi:hypothetical protein